MRIVAISDIHTYLPKELPKGDILVICGDITLSRRSDYWEQAKFLNTNFKLWLQMILPDFKEIIGIAGNHDVVYEKKLQLVEKLPWIYLQDSGCVVQGLKFWGYPWTPPFCGWGFNGDELTRETKLSKIPVGTDIIISHGPPYGIVDAISNMSNEHLGCKILKKHIERIQPKYVFCGHIHGSNNQQGKIGNTIIANVGYLDENYIPTGKISVFEI